MCYDNPSSSKENRPSTVQYQSYTSDKRFSIGFLVLAIILLTLSVAALIVVFTVENRWFYDTYNFTQINNPQSDPNRYGLWRLCFSNQSCASWFASDAPFGTLVGQRLNQSQAAINAWQALQIVFLFLTTSTLIIAFVSIICYKCQKRIHYYLAILSGFCIWPAVGTGIAALFVFGFSVYNVSTRPRGLDWCFGVNIAAVGLSFVGGIFSTIYAALVKRPIKHNESDNVSDLLADFTTFPTSYHPSPVPPVDRKKKKRKKPYEQPETGYPNPNIVSRTADNYPPPDYIVNLNHPMVAPYTSLTNNQHINPLFQQQPQQPPPPPQPHQQLTSTYRGPGLLPSPSAISNPMQQGHYQPPASSYHQEPPHWQRNEINPMNYRQEPAPDYIQHGIYRPGRQNPIERTFERKDEPRVLHHYTGFDNFSVIDPTDTASSRPHQSLNQSDFQGRYTVNPPFYQERYY